MNEFVVLHHPGSIDKKSFSFGFKIIANNKLCDNQKFMIHDFSSKIIFTDEDHF